jgi:hypothetical protein
MCGKVPAAVSLFDGRTLDGWIQIENSATTLSSAGITDPPSFAAELAKANDVSAFRRDGSVISIPSENLTGRGV